MEFDDADKIETEPTNGNLDIDQFELNYYKNKKTQELFHYALDSLIRKYNELGEQNSKKEGIYFMKDKHILLANLTEESILGYFKYKDLFEGLMAGKSKFFPEYDKDLDRRSHKSFSINYNNKIQPCISCKSDINIIINNLSINSLQLSKNKIIENEYNYKDTKIKYNLNRFSSYFNGLFFESITAEEFFNLIDNKYYDQNSNKKAISFLPRIMFYMKNKNQNEESNDYHGHNEIDCAFILKGKKS